MTPWKSSQKAKFLWQIRGQPRQGSDRPKYQNDGKKLSAGLPRQQLAVTTTVKARDSVSLPGHLGFSHPKEIHVAGQDRKMGIRGCRQTSPRVPIAEKDIHDQLQACLPADWLPKEKHPFKEQSMEVRVKGTLPGLCGRQEEGPQEASRCQLVPPNHKLFLHSTHPCKGTVPRTSLQRSIHPFTQGKQSPEPGKALPTGSHFHLYSPVLQRRG